MSHMKKLKVTKYIWTSKTFPYQIGEVVPILFHLSRAHFSSSKKSEATYKNKTPLKPAISHCLLHTTYLGSPVSTSSTYSSCALLVKYRQGRHESWKNYTKCSFFKPVPWYHTWGIIRMKVIFFYIILRQRLS